MDTEARILLDDIVSFCRRDALDARLVQMLAQSTAVALDDASLTVKAPSRFAYAHLVKQTAVIEGYLEEITFSPMTFIILSPSGEAEPGRTPTPEPATQSVGGAGTTATGEGGRESLSTAEAMRAPGSGAPFSTDTEGGAVGIVSGVSRETSSSAPKAGIEPNLMATGAAAHRADGAGEVPGDAEKPRFKNTLSPEDFNRLMAQLDDRADTATTASAASATSDAPAEADEPTPRYEAVDINSKFTFDTFVWGVENRMAYSSAVKFTAFAEEGGTCDTLFIYGHSGLGKTHLLLAIKNHLAKEKPWLRVKYANSQAYIDDYIREVNESKKTNKAILQDYHTADILIIDDIQNIIGKQASIEYFFQLVDEFVRSNRKIAIASDRAPKELAMDERLTSRFNSGMLCLVSEPGFEMKYTILKRYYEDTILSMGSVNYENVDRDLLGALSVGGGHLTDDQLRYMAEISGNNIRELESFCERCAHDSQEREQAGGELTGEDIKQIANQYFDTAQKVIHIGTVQSVVEEFYGVSHEEVIGPKRTANIAFARHMAVALACELCEMTLTQVGSAFGGRNHATVLNSIKVVEKKVHGDRRVHDEYQTLCNKIRLKS